MITDEQKIALLRERFVSREDTYALQTFEQDRGTRFLRQIAGFCYHSPRCRRGQCPDTYSIPLKDKDILLHLEGEQTIGLYQLAEDTTVKWLCLDVDVTKGFDPISYVEDLKRCTISLAKTANKMLGRGTYLVEQSGSKGFHLWFFFDQPIDARYAYTLGHVIVKSIEMPTGVHVEVYPKQIISHAYGNLVKMPLGIHRKTGNRCLFINAHFDPFEDQWQVLQDVTLLTKETVETVLAGVPLSQPTIVTESTDGLGRHGLPCLTRVMAEGLSEGSRDAGLFYLSVMMKDRGFPRDMAQVVLDAVNAKSHPPLEEVTVTEKLSSAYNNTYGMFPCRNGSMDSYCSSSCTFWPNKVKDRWSGDPALAVGRLSRD